MPHQIYPKGWHLASGIEKHKYPVVKRGILVSLAYLLLSLFLSMPLVMNITTHVPYGGDAFQTLWDFWWVRECIDGNGSPWSTHMMFAPDGVSLALHDMTWLNSVPGALIHAVTGNRVLAFNLLWITSLSLSGYFMYLYARRHLGDGLPAFAAGCMFAFSTYHMHHGAQLGSMWTGWLPLFQMYLEDALGERANLKPIGKAALVLAAAGYTHWYLMAFCLFQLLFTMIWKMLTVRPFSARSIGYGAVIAVAAVILTLPILIPAAAESAGFENQHLKIDQRDKFGANMASLIIPSPRHPVFGRMTSPVYSLIPGNITESPVYPGWILWILFISAMLVRNPIRGRVAFFSICFLILALGLKPQFLSASLNIPLPYTLFQYVPGLDFIRVPARFIAPAMIFLSLGAAMGMLLIGRKIGSDKIRSLFFIVIIILALFDTTIFPMPTRDTTAHSEFYSRLAEMDDGIVFDYPSYTYQEYLFYQTVHEKPIIGGYGIYLTEGRAQDLINLSAQPWKAQELGIKYVILHKGFKNPVKDTITIINNMGEFEVQPDVFFGEVMGYSILHEDEYIIAYKVDN